jgi:hypothetical protein
MSGERSLTESDWLTQASEMELTVGPGLL